MTSELKREVRAELNDHLRNFVAQANDYIDLYVEQAVRGRKAAAPRPANLHPCLAKLVREVTLDAAVAARRR